MKKLGKQYHNYPNDCCTMQWLPKSVLGYRILSFATDANIVSETMVLKLHPLCNNNYMVYVLAPFIYLMVYLLFKYETNHKF